MIAGVIAVIFGIIIILLSQANDRERSSGYYAWLIFFIVAFATSSAISGHNGTSIKPSNIIKPGEIFRAATITTKDGSRYAIIVPDNGDDPRLVKWDNKSQSDYLAVTEIPNGTQFVFDTDKTTIRIVESSSPKHASGLVPASMPAEKQ